MEQSRSQRPRRTFAALLLAILAIVLPAHAAAPVPHTYFDSDPDEDLKLNATTPDGRMPAAIDTPSGVIPAPDLLRGPNADEPAYGGSSTPGSVDATYRIDRNTTRPDSVSYDDPFIPAVTPFKRLYAYDVVDAALELGVADKSLKQIPIGGAVRSGDDQFYGDMIVDLAQDAPVRIPSVGPGARVLAAHTNPTTQFKLLRDGADNWFVQGTERKRVRLIVQLAIAREVFGSAFASTSWAQLSRHASQLPANVRVTADRVLEKLGVNRDGTPSAAVNALVMHFRSFAPSNDRPTSSGSALYEELALSKKGVCRHRAYAFVITAHALGLPARMIRNEAHAWVEVFDGAVWHRIDLGGAAERLDTERDPNQAMHAPPLDPYNWPEGSEGGQDLVRRTLSPSGGSARAGTPSARDTTAADGGSSLVPVPSAAPPGSVDGGEQQSQSDTKPPSKISIAVKASQVRRGEPLSVSGRVESDGEGCRGVRVDFALRSDSGRTLPVQSLSASDDGRFDGAIVIPLGVEVGDYELVVSTPGDVRCGTGKTE